MIPVLIVPVVSRFDLLDRLLDSVSDVQRLVIVDNSCSGLQVPGADVIRPIAGLGYPGGINAGIAQAPDAPWWAFCSVDIEFGACDLGEVARLIGGPGPRVVTGSRNDGRLLRWTYGAVNLATIQRVGLMDEWAFYPIYYDDDDYERRCRLAGVEWIEYDGSIRHGDDGTEGSVTIKSDPEARAANARSFPANWAEYVAKWGGPPGQETFTTPYDLPVPLSFVRPDPATRAARQW